jgi:hypothetical protein
MDQPSSNPNESKCNVSCSDLTWWATLVIAVLAVPSFGVVVAMLTPIRGLGQIIIFVLACWLCTYIGMILMKYPHKK